MPDCDHHAQQGEHTYTYDPQDLTHGTATGGPDPCLISNRDDSTNAASIQVDRPQGSSRTQTKGKGNHQDVARTIVQEQEQRTVLKNSDWLWLAHLPSMMIHLVLAMVEPKDLLIPANHWDQQPANIPANGSRP